jgi:hypothetical protein
MFRRQRGVNASDQAFNKRLTSVEKETEKLKQRLTVLEIEAKIFKPRERAR